MGRNWAVGCVGVEGREMSEKQFYRLVHMEARRRAAEACMTAPDGFVVRVSEPNKSRDQEEKYHAMIGDIAKSCKHLNMALDSESWKRLLVDQFKRDTLNDPDIGDYWRKNQLSMMPSLDGSAIIVLGEQTRKFPKKVASAFIEWLFAFGANSEDAVWSDDYREAA